MKLKQIALAVSAACVAAPAFALTPANIDSSTVQLWISGATAPTASVFAGVKALCADADDNGTPDDLHVYVADASNTKLSKWNAYFCTMGPNAGDLDGVKTLVYHTADAGSFEAYTPHLFLAGEPGIDGTLKRMNAIDGTNTCTPASATTALGEVYSNCGSSSISLAFNTDQYSAPTLPQGGFSDTEYTLNQLNLNILASLTDIGGETQTNVGQAFGLIASYPLYYYMQQKDIAAGLIAATCDDAPYTTTSPNLTLACQPNASRQQYSSLVSAGGVSNKDASLFGAPAGSILKVERRVGTSGTQSASNAFFLNKPCANGSAGGQLGVAGLNTAGTFTNANGKVVVRSNNGSSDVKNNVTAASNAGEYAIGVLSMENAPSGTDKYAFVKLNGVSPNEDANQRLTAIKGDYEFWYELVAFTAGTAFPEGQILIEKVTAALGDPAITNLKGLFVTAASGLAPYPTNSNVSKGFKNGNACSPAIQN